MDFSTPSVKQVSDFFMNLYQDVNKHPSTIDGYKTAIVDTLGPAGHHIAQSSDLHRLLSSFHRDRPKSSRNLPKWNLSVVLNELTKAPFEPMKDTDLKHLTLKTAFLLALASGKRHSEIHAWVANKVSNLGQWEKVALFPSSDFIAKNQLAREGSQSVSPVTIPALTTIVDRQFKEDRTLCLVWALRYFHWKAHNTFTNFYLKDLTWSDNNNNMYLGPVVAALQVLDPSPQTRYPRKEKKGGGGGGHIRYNQVFRSLIPGSRYRFTSQDVTGKVIFYF